MAFSFLAIARRISEKAAAIAAKAGGSRITGTNPLGQKTIRADTDLEGLVIGELKRAGIPCVLASEEAGLVELSKSPRWKFVLDPLDGSENYKRGVPIYCLGLCYAPINGRSGDILESYVIDLARPDEFYAKRGGGVWRNGKRVRPSSVKSMRGAIISLDFHNEIIYNEIGAKGKLALLQCPDQRRFGPDLLDMCYAACGGVDGFVHGCKTLSAVHASGVALMGEDCVVSDRHGEPINAELDVEESMSVVAAGTKELHAELLAALRR